MRKILFKVRKLIILILFLSAAVIATAADNTPTIKTFVVGNIYNTNNMTDANGEWYALRYDAVINQRMSSAVHDSMVKYNPDLIASIYANGQSIDNRTDGGRDPYYYLALMRAVDSASASAESMFVHFDDSVVVQTLDDGTRWLNIDSLKSAGNDSATRVSMRAWYNDNESGYYPAGDGEWFCNVTSSTYRLYRSSSMAWLWRNQDSIFAAFDSVINYVYLDNMLLDYQECGSNYWLNGSGRKVDSSADSGNAFTDVAADVDWDISDQILSNDNTVIRPHLWNTAGDIQDSLVGAGYGGVIANMSSSAKTNVHDFVDTYEPSGLFFETRGNVILASGYVNGWNNYVRIHDTAIVGNPTTMQMWEFRCQWVSDTTTTDADRFFLASINAFLCYQDTAVDYFHFGEADQDYWWSGHEIDLGPPVGNYDSMDCSGANDWVFYRRYLNGFSLYRPYVSDTTASGAITLVDIHDSLGLGDTTLYQIGASLKDTLATINNSDNFDIKELEGVYFLFVTGEEPPEPPPAIMMVRKKKTGE